MRSVCRRTLPLLALLSLALSLRAQGPAGPADLLGTLERIGQRVTQYYAQARSIVCIETVVLQPLTYSYSFDGPGRELTYELRVEWEPDEVDGVAEAKVVRRLIAIGGRPPRPKDKPHCTDPQAVSPESLAFLLPAHRSEYAFKWKGSGRTDGRQSLMVDYKPLAAKHGNVSWHDDCVSIEIEGGTSGRVWIDPDTGDVIRMDEHLIGIFEFPVPRDREVGGPRSMVVERADSSVSYRPVAFHDPDETMMLPSSIVSTSMIRNSGGPGLRKTQRYSDYRRFVTAGRVVKEGG